MKKILIILIAILIFTSCVHAQDNTTVEINGVIFEIPEKYQVDIHIKMVIVQIIFI